MTPGMVSYGIRWDSVNVDLPSREDISYLSPTSTHAAWCPSKIVAPPSKLAFKPWYTYGDAKDDEEKGPGTIQWAVSPSGEASRVVGEIWVTYDVTLSGMHR